MAWGVVHRGDITGNYTYRSEREVIERLLQLFEKYDIAATFAIVGHLFLDRCKPVNGRKHPGSTGTGSTLILAGMLILTPYGTEETSWSGLDDVGSLRR